MTPERIMKSAYMQWAKTSAAARYNLASSDLAQLPLADLPCSIGDLEISGPGGYGYPPLREAIASNYSVDPTSVVTTLGTSMANHLAMAALVKPGDEVVIEQPTYELILSTARYLGADVRRLPRRPEDSFLIDPGEVERAVGSRTRLVILTNLHNPSSAFTDEPTLRRIGDIARHAGARVLVDEVYLDAAFDRHPRTAYHLGEEFIITNSLTKVYGLTGLRCGWVLAEPSIADKIWRLADLFYSTLPHAAERLSVIAFQNLPAISERARRLLEANGAAINEFFRTRSDLETIMHERGLIAFPGLKSGDAGPLCKILRDKYETSVVPGGFFDMPGHFRIGLGLETDHLKGGLSRVAAALDEIAGR